MRLLVPSMFFLAVLPRVEDPWPEVIGIEFPFTIAGGFGLLAGVLFASRSEAERNEAVRNGGRLGFWLGALFYSLALSNQVISGI